MYRDATSCAASGLCYWDGFECDGNDFCDQFLDQVSCDASEFCMWDGLECDLFEYCDQYLDAVSCAATGVCEWDGLECDVIELECDLYYDPTTCAAAGCFWDGEECSLELDSIHRTQLTSSWSSHDTVLVAGAAGLAFIAGISVAIAYYKLVMTKKPTLDDVLLDTEAYSMYVEQ